MCYFSRHEHLIKSSTTYALRRAIREVGSALHLNFRHLLATTKTRRVLAASPEKRLNLGCGENLKPGWVNVDLFYPCTDLCLDLRERWPFHDASVSYIYTKHAFEHFEIELEVPNFLTEAFRVLQPGGVIDIGVPNTEGVLKAYGDRTHGYWEDVSRNHPRGLETRLEHINHHFRQGGEHKYAWDEETLRRFLERFHFTEVERRAFDPALDSERRKVGTLYMRAVKNGGIGTK